MKQPSRYDLEQDKIKDKYIRNYINSQPSMGVPGGALFEELAKACKVMDIYLDIKNMKMIRVDEESRTIYFDGHC